MSKEAQKFDYYEYDGVVFRCPPGYSSCNEVNDGSGWRPYEGESGLKAKYYGSKLSEAEAEEFIAAPAGG